MQHSPAVAAARAAAAAAAADTARVDVAPNPFVQASVSNTRAGRYPYGSSDRLLRLEQMVERGGKRERRRELALALAEAAQHEAADVLRQQLALLGVAHADLVAAQRLEALARENVADSARLAQAGAQRVAAGDLATADKLRLDVEALRATGEQQAAHAAIAQARATVVSLIGLRALAAPLTAAAANDALPRGEALLARIAGSSALAEAIDARPDVQAAGQRLLAAERAYALAASLRVRDVTIGMQFERAPDLGGTVVGVSLGVPLLVNNDYRGELQRAQAEIEVARTQRDRVRLAAVTEAHAALARLSSALDRAARLERESVPRARTVAAMVEAGFAQGGSSLNDLVDTRRQLVAVRAEAVQAEAEIARALAQWRAAVPGDELAAAWSAAGRRAP